MDAPFILIIIQLLFVIEIKSQYYKETSNQYGPKTSVCELERKRLGDRKIIMIDGTEIQGIKIQFKQICNLRDVYEFRGLPYAEIGLSRFLSPRDQGRSTSSVRHAINHKAVCPQKVMKDFLRRLEGIPTELHERLSRIGTFIGDQNEECLFINIFVPYKGRSIAAYHPNKPAFRYLLIYYVSLLLHISIFKIVCHVQ
jgi:hypothetical protein